MAAVLVAAATMLYGQAGTARGTFWGWGDDGSRDWPFKTVTSTPALVDLR